MFWSLFLLRVFLQIPRNCLWFLCNQTATNDIQAFCAWMLPVLTAGEACVTFSQSFPPPLALPLGSSFTLHSVASVYFSSQSHGLSRLDTSCLLLPFFLTTIFWMSSVLGLYSYFEFDPFLLILEKSRTNFTILSSPIFLFRIMASPLNTDLNLHVPPLVSVALLSCWSRSCNMAPLWSIFLCLIRLLIQGKQ